MKLFKQMETTFENFDMTVRSYLSKVFNSLGLQYTHTQVFGVIFDGIKGVMQNIMLYIEDAFTEQNVYTASRKKSVYSLAKISGFEPNYGTSAGGVLIAKLHVNNGLNKNNGNLYIKNHTLVVNKNTGIKYSIILPTDYYIFSVANPLIEYQFKVQQGIFVKNQYVSKGNELETIHIDSSDLFDRQFITVTVDGEKWSEVSCLYDMSQESKEYMFSIGYDNSFDIIFGNGIYGKKLMEGQVVEIEYLRHYGTLGNIGVNDISEFEFDRYVEDTIGNNVNANDYISLSINTTISGGSNADDIDFIRTMVGSNSRSLIYSSAENMKLFLKRFSFIGYNNCYSSLKYNKIYIIALQNIEAMYKDKKDYFTLTNEQLLLTTDQQNMIIDTLNNSNRTLAGFSVEFITPVFRKFSIVCFVKVNSKYHRQIARQIIEDSLLDYFLDISYDVKFIPKSELINAVLNNDTDKIIESFDINIISEYNENAYKNNEYIQYYDDVDTLDINKYIVNKYTLNNTPGLDSFGNISLNSIYEIPRICGGFQYYTNKRENVIDHSNESMITTNAIDIHFI